MSLHYRSEIQGDAREMSSDQKTMIISTKSPYDQFVTVYIVLLVQVHILTPGHIG